MRRLWPFVALPVLILLAGLWIDSGSDTGEGPLRVAINPWPGYEFAALARELGFFEEEGVQVHLVELSSLSDARRAFDRGQVHGMFATIVEVLLSNRESDRYGKITLVTDYSNGADVILASPDIRTLSELRGRRIAIEPGSLNELMLLRALAAAGLSRQDVHEVGMSAMEMPRAFLEGRIDAAICYPPYSLEIARGVATEVFSSRDIPGVVLDVLAFDAQTVAERPDDIAAFNRAFFRAQDYAVSHPAQAQAIMAARQGISADEFQTAMTTRVTVLTREEQAEYLVPGHRLDQVLQVVNADLDQLRSADGGAIPRADNTHSRNTHADETDSHSE